MLMQYTYMYMYVHSSITMYIFHLQVHPVNVLKPVLGWDEFLNEELNNRVNMAYDYRLSNDQDLFTGERHFSFLAHPFILSTANKVEKLLRDNMLAHFSERQRTFVHTILTGVRDTPFLHLHISREDILSDTLSQVSCEYYMRLCYTTSCTFTTFTIC